MPVTLHTHGAASEKILATGARKVRAFVKAQRAILESGEGTATDRAIIGAIVDALSTDNGRRVAGIQYRHVMPPMSKAQRAIVAEIHGADHDGKECPALVAEGVTPQAARLAQHRNGKDTDRDMRATTYRCPCCADPDVVRTLRATAGARDAEARWNTR